MFDGVTVEIAVPTVDVIVDGEYEITGRGSGAPTVIEIVFETDCVVPLAVTLEAVTT